MNDVFPVRTEVPWQAKCGEGPVWDARTKKVLWVDILDGAIYSTHFNTHATSSVRVPTLVGAAAPRSEGGYVLAVTEGFATATEDGAFSVDAAILRIGERMNDAKCDPRGRFWAGSTDVGFARRGGALWVLDQEWRPQRVSEGLTLPNGMGWSPDASTFYLVDTIERTITAFDYDVDDGTMADGRVIIAFPDASEGVPDGMCVDQDGNLWIAMWGGARILRFHPDGTRIATIPVPVEQPSSCAFVGPRLDNLWLTSARDGLDRDATDTRPDGSILRIETLGVAGQPTTTFAG